MFWLENLKGTDHSEDLGVDEKINYIGSGGKRVGRCGLDSSGLAYGPVTALMNTVMKLRIP
jgi:hypothetical protein